MANSQHLRDGMEDRREILCRRARVIDLGSDNPAIVREAF